MKKVLYAGIVAYAMLSLTSCNNSDDNYITETYSIPTYNLITSEDASEAAIVTLTGYHYTMTYPENSVSMKVSDMEIGTSTANFNTPTVPMRISGVKMSDDFVAEQITFESKDIPENTLASDVNCMLTQAAYAPEEIEVPMDVPSANDGQPANKSKNYERLIPGVSQHFTVMSYNYGQYKVRTFWPDMTFCGETSSTMPGMPASFINKKMSYRVYMHRNQNNSLSGKADVIIYSASFAQGMPDITIVVKGLDIKFDNNGYQLIGENIIPYMVEAGQLQEAPRFKFNDIKMEVSGDLTSMHAAFTVAGSMKANFIGNSIKK